MGSADQKHARAQRAGNQASELSFDDRQMEDSSHAASVMMSERLESDVHAEDCPTSLHARDSSFQPLAARAGPPTVSDYPADPEAPSPDRDGLLLGGAPHSPGSDRQQPMLRAAPCSPDREQPSLGAGLQTPGRGSGVQASANNHAAEGMMHSGPKARQQAARALQEGLSHAPATAQCMSTGIHTRPGN